MERDTILDIVTLLDDGVYDQIIPLTLQKTIVYNINEILECPSLDTELSYPSLCLPVLVLMEQLDLLKQLHNVHVDLSSTLLLNLAIYKQNTELIHFLLQTVYMVEAFHVFEAISLKNLEIIKILTDYIFITDEITSYNVIYGSIEIAQYFIDIECEIGIEILFKAIEYKKQDMLEFYIDKKPNYLDNCLHFAIKDANLIASKYLLRKKGSLDVNLLKIAAANREDNIEIFKYINQFFSTEYCGNCKLHTSTCINCLHYKTEGLIAASSEGNVNIIEHIILHDGIDVNVNNGLPLSSAAYNHLDLTVKFLLALGADATLDDSLALDLACRNRDYVTAQILLEHGANPNTFNGKALSRASYSGHVEIVKLLVEHGANVSINHNKSVLVAVLNKHFDIVTYLIENGASIHIYPGLSIEVIDAIKLYKKTQEPLKLYIGEIKEEDQDCAICLVEMKEGLTQCDTCKKVTHLDCQNKWGRTCVYCRQIN